MRILDFKQGGEGLIGPGELLNRRADFARGYVVMRFTREEATESSFNRNFLPNEEIVVICPTIGGHREALVSTKVEKSSVFRRDLTLLIRIDAI